MATETPRHRESCRSIVRLSVDDIAKGMVERLASEAQLVVRSRMATTYDAFCGVLCLWSFEVLEMLWLEHTISKVWPKRFK